MNEKILIFLEKINFDIFKNILSFEMDLSISDFC